MIAARPLKTLVLGLGNDLLADDAVGILAARALAPQLAGRADVLWSSVHGIALLDILLGYSRAIFIDAIHTGQHPPGTILQLNPRDLPPVPVPSPHYTGLPEMLALAQQLGLDFPQQLTILAVEVSDVSTIGGPMTPAVEHAIPALCERIRNIL